MTTNSQQLNSGAGVPSQQLMWTGEIFRFVPKTFETSPELPAGSYSAGQTDKGELLIKPQPIVSDRLVAIPSREYDLVTSEITTFLRNETRDKYKELGFLYKRSFFLYGKPGTGKSCLVNRVAKEVIEGGGIVLVNTNHPGTIQMFLQEIRAISPGRVIMVILEEFDAAIKAYRESEYLTMLDGQIQIDNVVFLGTTNYIENIPARLLRPGRFSRVLEVGYPSDLGREAYIRAIWTKLDTTVVAKLVKGTKGCSIDEVREALQASLLLGDDLRTTVRNLKKIRGVTEDELRNEDEQDKYDERGLDDSSALRQAPGADVTSRMQRTSETKDVVAIVGNNVPSNPHSIVTSLGNVVSRFK